MSAPTWLAKGWEVCAVSTCEWLLFGSCLMHCASSWVILHQGYWLQRTREALLNRDPMLFVAEQAIRTGMAIEYREFPLNDSPGRERMEQQNT